MQLVLLVTNDCGLCAGEIEKLKVKYGPEIKTEEVAIYNIDDNEKSKEFWITNNLPTPPVLVLVTDDAKYVATLPIDAVLSATMEKANA